MEKLYLYNYILDYNIKLIEDSIDFLKGHPYYCQLALQQMYLYHLSKGKAPSTDILIDIITNSERSYLEKLWEDISSNKELVLTLKHLSTESTGVYAMASHQKINTSRAIKKLEGAGIIYQEDNAYHYYDLVFQYWVANTIK